MDIMPVTREEQYLAKAGGQDVETPIPITRREFFLDAVAKRQTGGGGSGIDVTAQVGQTIMVKEVDSNGKPTKWEAVDFPSGVEDELLCEIVINNTSGEITTTKDSSGNDCFYRITFNAGVAESVSASLANLYALGRPMYAQAEVPNIGKFVCACSITGSADGVYSLSFYYVNSFTDSAPKSAIVGAVAINNVCCLFNDNSLFQALSYGLSSVTKIYALQ